MPVYDVNSDNANDSVSAKNINKGKGSVNNIINVNGNVSVENVPTAESKFINISKKFKKPDGYVRVGTYLLPVQVKAIEELQKKLAATRASFTGLR